MLRFFTFLSLLMGTLFAHGKEADHVHFFSSMHVEGLVLFVVTFALAVGTFFYLKKKA
jgi:hypothetical protein